MKKYWSISGILIVAAALRLINLTSISLWHDEAFSALLIRYSWSEMLYRIGLDVHPPMYYIFLRIWHYGFGDSLFALRGMSVFFGVLTVWAAWLLVKEAFKSEKVALWAALLVAVNPFSVQYVTEARMYTMGAFFAVLAAYFLVRALHQQKALFEAGTQNMPNLPGSRSLKRKMLFSYLGFALSIIVLIYTHYYLLFTAAAICFYGLLHLYFHHQGTIKKYAWLLISFAIMVVSYLPWLKTFLFQYKQVGAGYWIPPMDVWSIPSTLWTLLFGIGHDVTKTRTQILLVVTFIFAVYFLYRFIKKTQNFEKWLILLAILAPFAGAFLFYFLSRLKGSGASVYLVRYFLYTSAFLSIALAVWLAEIKQRVLANCLLGVCVLFNLFAVYHFWNDLGVSTKPGMAAAAKFLAANVQPEDKLYVGSSFEFFNFKYYNRTPVRPLLYTGGSRDVHSMPHFAGTAILTNEDLVPDFNEQTRRGDLVWLLWTNGFGSSKPETPKNWAKIDEKGFAEVRPYVGTWVIVTEYKVQ
ncbi:MAG: glycosyltransferase family 39 protein [Patescibacteria group bacterium]|nr:glycosyltransferase family 39 protein [Patescibacteria group bacterium]